MESSHSLNSKRQITNYVLIPIALVQSEIYWICSVLYYIFKHSLDVLEEQQVLDDKKRRRANSAPTRSISAPASPVEQQQSLHYVTFADKHKVESYNETVPTKSLRRKSLPDMNIRHRPSVHDERNGRTCPPRWWQKTRVKLGHTPIHGDPKPIMTEMMLDNHQGAVSTSINNTGVDAPYPSPTSSSTTVVSSTLSSARPSLEQVKSDSSSSSIQSQESDTTNKKRDGTNASTSSKKGSRLISKISARFHKQGRSRG